MKAPLFTLRSAAGITLLALTLPALTLPAFGQEVFTLQWQESGTKTNRAGYRPNSLMLSTQAPETLRKAPAGLAAPQYGAIQVGPSKSPTRMLAIVDQADGKPTRLIVDGNANGDLTDDPAHDWTAKTTERPDGSTAVTYYSEATIRIPFASGPRPAHLIFYALEGRVPGTQEKRLQAYYYADYGLVGTVKIDGESYPMLLEDAGVTGEFRLSSEVMRTPTIWLDLDRDGKPGRGESVLASRPFQVAGKWWAITNLTPEGAFQIAAAAKPPEPKQPAGPDLSPGQKAPVFTAKLTSGKTVSFPADYKGKVVLLDFWATWCGPCVAEIPNVVKAYEKFHPQGLEVLGISLDREDWEQKLADFTKKKAMPWPQVYDGKFWSAEVAKLYGIHAIPHMLLVDGDTGLILANKDVRGEALAPAIEKGLAGRKQ